MKLQLTTELLKFLTDQGYQYCFSRTMLSGSEDDKVTITLTPVHSRPKIRQLPKAYDTYFCLNQEPCQMATGLTGILVLIDLKRELLVSYFNHMLFLEDKNISVMKAKRLKMFVQE